MEKADSAPTPLAWPAGKRFGFTIFDDPDSQTWEAGREVYALLRDLGFRTTKGLWPMGPIRTPSDHGLTCAHPGYSAWIRSLVQSGFEAGYHNATSHTCTREETARGLDLFRSQFGAYPRTMAQHYNCDENLYWGEGRLSGWRRTAYNLFTRYRNHDKFFGHVEGHPYYWGDLCRDRIEYCRSFTFKEINTRKAWPLFPYHDPVRPLVRLWFPSSEGSNKNRFCSTLSEANQERLEEEEGLCILYTHFGHGYYDGALDKRFISLMERLAKRPGWFVPVGPVLDFMRSQEAPVILNDGLRAKLERRWLWHKIFYGTA
ncbi:MAG: hypothetical protein M3Y27_02470 [Acidobacteriota bacterium]|nr:hypothetical protein [Acidobacteriota bacterium]